MALAGEAVRGGAGAILAERDDRVVLDPLL
jgi:hypothetical protein